MSNSHHKGTDVKDDCQCRVTPHGVVTWKLFRLAQLTPVDSSLLATIQVYHFSVSPMDNSPREAIQAYCPHEKNARGGIMVIIGLTPVDKMLEGSRYDHYK